MTCVIYLKIIVPTARIVAWLPENNVAQMTLLPIIVIANKKILKCQLRIMLICLWDLSPPTSVKL